MVKSKRTDNDQLKERPFPKLQKGKHSDNIYLMYSSIEGVIVNNSKEGHQVGSVHSNLNSCSLKDYAGEITLSND